MNPEIKETIKTKFDALRREAVRRQDLFRLSAAPKIHIGMATCGIAAGALETKAAFEETLKERNIEAHVHTVGCLGHCYAEPVVIIEHPDAGFPPIFYHEVTPGKAKMLTKMYIEGGDPRFEHVYGATEVNDMIPSVMDFSRFSMEKRVVMDKCGKIDPDDIYEYIAADGYAALFRALQMPPEEIVDMIKQSGLRGRGGAGFPTGVKWEMAFRVEHENKIVICNADEGDPGAYMDRTLLESNPHQVLEGMMICALAVGADAAIIYVRAEYPLAVKTLARAIRQAHELNLLGEGILGSEFNLEIDIFEGSGAFVCGEETGLIQSIEGYRGMPRHRPPYPVKSGLYGRPTVINNVKTLALVPPIVTQGAAWFRGIGTEGSPGTAVFSVVGDVVHPGLVEIPMGVTLRTLIFDICGGIPNHKGFKAVQIGGPSGGCLPESFLDTPIDFDSLTGAGAMMGSGGMVVMNEDTCVVNVSRYFLDFTQKESCGKCTFCRIGTRHLLSILDRLTCGTAHEGDLDLLASLAGDVKAGSLCGLGKTAPNPVLTSLKYFRDEYEAHLKEGRCPGMMCRPLTAFYIDLDACARGCDACALVCPTDAVFTTSTRKKGIDQSLCVKCGECVVACPPEYDAVRKVSPPSLAPVIQRPETPPTPDARESGDPIEDENPETSTDASKEG
ncbi:MULTISPECIES: NADH-ubiquinone oxidoreductase-F iron-sulfur binding region domain-containing protein [Desulfococcus]|uniref:Respiratory-chain NADH dehydrogenase domain 51 kDa subunit n=1 Tax=Desulfococcus multivorans DSM 2059 TaxID=1121405 RepID=S7V4K8_DESML|nr:NADH-ubiquinone oxidoreductase-F iron-sulfur binding region domain-containing protein [Desulfococcus multivorans]AQV00913.1 NADH dehydrogenase [Desulfococcus multivorans]EPR41534.1 Respiratory-chain NADH dehydrogenase domain 51 kDa subunit [Desulfococcus multivorans DSM 2059]SJZ44706.1 NADH-quinone oxidoreductase subunit F [Desulfococcus multivorans DSM 2059]